MYVQFFGDIFLNMLKCLIIPLIVSSIVRAIGSLDLSLTTKIGFRAITFYAVTTSVAVLQGVFLVTVIQPGRNSSNSNSTSTISTFKNVMVTDKLMDYFR